MTTQRLSLLALLALTAGLALAQDTLDPHELNNCPIDIRDGDDPLAILYALDETGGGGNVKFTFDTPVSTIEMSDFGRTVDTTTTPPAVIAVTAEKNAENTATFQLNTATMLYDLQITNGTVTKTFTSTNTVGTYYEHGPFSYGRTQVRGPGGGPDGEERTLLIWFENHGLKSGFTLTDIGS